MIDPAFRRRDARQEGRKQYSWIPSMELSVPTTLPSALPPDYSYIGPDSETEVYTVTVTAQRQLPTDITDGPRPWSTRVPPYYGPNGYVHYSDKTRLTTSPTPVYPYSSGSLASTTTSTDAASSSSASSLAGRRGPPLAVKAAVGVVAVLLLCLGGLLLFFFLRKRKRQHHQQGTTHVQSEQMKANDARPFFELGYNCAPVPSGAGGSVSLPPIGNPTVSQPVILGPIVPDANGAYNTGIDTSDMISLHDHIEIENPFADPVYHNDEPPPPYRPRSVAPLSRNVSLREIPPMRPGRRLGEDSGENVRSPFDDGATS